MQIRNIVLLTLIIFPSFLFAQESQLTLDQLNEFSLRKLIVELYETTETGRPYAESNRWKAYQGKKMISERRFYLLAGHQYEADKARKQNIVSIVELVGSPAVFVIGGIVLKYLAKNPPESEEGSEGVAYLVFGTVGVGGFLFIEGTKGLAYRSTTYSRAEQVKNEYNDKLIQEIIGKNE